MKIIPALILLSMLAGCSAFRPNYVVIGHSGRAFTAPDLNSAIFQCQGTDPPCFVDE